MRALLAAAIAAACALPCSGAEIELCYNYGCSARASVRYEPATLREIGAMFEGVDSGEAERAAIARAVGELLFVASLDTPLWRDRGENYNDDGADGRMDCIDHSTNATTLLRLLDERGWLRFHRIGEPVERGRLVWIHWGARVVDSGGSQWVVDTWFLDPGHPATIYALDTWLGGAHPPRTALLRAD